MRHASHQTDTARRLRRDLTPAEARLWQILRGSRVGGWKFRRQHPIGPYFADFCCVSCRLIVELDGDAHLGQQHRDAVRDQYLRDQGYEVLRFENCEVLLSENAVIERVIHLCHQREGGKILPYSPLSSGSTPSPLTPLPEGRGEPA
ncbi:MAG: DUF559 domain-containing protein [Gemmataceae bacterium]